MSAERGQRFVVYAANRYGDERMFIGIRHFCPLMRKNMASSDIKWMRDELGEQQGFVDQWGVFMTREEAWKVAEAAGQIRFRCGGDGEKLFSENLY
jgi:hypothetical protein